MLNFWADNQLNILLTTVFLWLIISIQESFPSDAKNKEYSEPLKEGEVLHLYKQ